MALYHDDSLFHLVVNLCSYSYPWDPVRKKVHELSFLHRFPEAKEVIELNDLTAGISARFIIDNNHLHFNFTGLRPNDLESLKACFQEIPSYYSYLKNREKLFEHFEKVLSRYQEKLNKENYKIFLSGHSMGGTLAQLFLVDLQKKVLSKQNKIYQKITEFSLGVQNSCGVPKHIVERFEKNLDFLKSKIPHHLYFIQGKEDLVQHIGYYLKSNAAHTKVYRFSRPCTFTQLYLKELFILIIIGISFSTFSLGFACAFSFFLISCMLIFFSAINHLYAPKAYHSLISINPSEESNPLEEIQYSSLFLTRLMSRLFYQAHKREEDFQVYKQANHPNQIEVPIDM